MEKELELRTLALDIMMKMKDLEQATYAMTLALGEKEEDWWEECLGVIDDGLTEGCNILSKRFGITFEENMLMTIFRG